MAAPPQVTLCAHCGSAEVTQVSLFGGQLMTSQYRCNSCLSYFEQIRWNESEDEQESHSVPRADADALEKTKKHNS